MMMKKGVMLHLKNIILQNLFPGIARENEVLFKTDLSVKSGRFIFINFEIKNEVGVGGTSPNLQQAAYFLIELLRSPLHTF